MKRDHKNKAKSQKDVFLRTSLSYIIKRIGLEVIEKMSYFRKKRIFNDKKTFNYGGLW